MKRLIPFFLVLLLTFSASILFAGAEDETSIDPAIGKLLKRYASVCTGVNVVYTPADSGTQPFLYWTPAVRIGDGDILMSSELLTQDTAECKFTMQQGKARARCDFKAINERFNIALIRPSVGVSGGVSFIGDLDVAVGSKLYVLNCLGPETGFAPEIIPFYITAVLEPASGKLLVTDLLSSSRFDPRYIGCPVFDDDGKVAGIINTISADDTKTLVLYPNATVRKAISKAINPKDTSQKKCWFGAFTKELTQEWLEKLNLPGDLQGALIEDVIQGSPAASAGLQSLDVVIDINGVLVAGPDARDLNAYFSNNFRPGEEVALNVFRNNERISLPVKLLERPTSVRDAPSYIDEKIGLEVRDLTTDIRIEFGIDVKAIGVLTYEYIPRKPFQVAIARALSISFPLSNGIVIEKVNDKEIKSVAEFKAQLEAARAKNEKFATLFIRYNKDGERGCINTSFLRVDLTE